MLRDEDEVRRHISMLSSECFFFFFTITSFQRLIEEIKYNSFIAVWI